MSEQQFKDAVEWARRARHDDTDIALIWADDRIAELEKAPNYHRAKAALKLYNMEYVGQKHDPLWEWAWNEAGGNGNE